MTEGTLDAVIVGGGHNGLVAAAYLARAGRRVQVLERSDHVGGAAVSAHAFDGVDARLSRYSYLVSLLPQRIVTDLGARIRLSRRRYSSYTPDPLTGGTTGLLIPPGRLDLFARRVRDLLSSPLRLEAYGIAAADRATARYSRERISRETLTAYEHCLRPAAASLAGATSG